MKLDIMGLQFDNVTMDEAAAGLLENGEQTVGKVDARDLLLERRL